jgi:hypothetical protein
VARLKNFKEEANKGWSEFISALEEPLEVSLHGVDLLAPRPIPDSCNVSALLKATEFRQKNKSKED